MVVARGRAHSGHDGGCLGCPRGVHARPDDAPGCRRAGPDSDNSGGRPDCVDSGHARNSSGTNANGLERHDYGFHLPEYGGANDAYVDVRPTFDGCNSCAGHAIDRDDHKQRPICRVPGSVR